MTQTYRTNDLAKWGSGKGSDLTPAEVDINFWDLIQRLLTLEALPGAAAGIDHFTVSGTQFTVVMTDATTLGPYTLPVATFLDRGTWAPSTLYSVMDTFTINGGLYVVIFAHTSELSFDPGANDGTGGHDFYKLMIQTPGSSLPTGGATGQVLQKSSGTNYAVTWGWKTPTGGTARQYLIKINSTQDNAEWDTPTASDIEFVPSTGSALSSTNVADAIEEVSDRLSGTTVAMADLTDVFFSTGDPLHGELLYYDGSNWTAAAVGALTNELLSYDGTTWVGKAESALSVAFSQITGSASTAQLRNGTVTALATTGSPTVDISLGDVFTITPAGSVSLVATDVTAGAEITIVITTSGTSSFNVTPSTNFKSQGALATGTSSGKKFTMKFVGDGSFLNEVSRTTAM